MSNFKKVNFTELIDSIERVIFHWIRVRKHRLPLLIIIVIMLAIISNAPYINLFLNNYLIIFISVTLAPLILDIGERPFFIAALLLLVLSLLFVLSGHRREEAEMVGGYIFILLFAGLLRIIFSSDKSKD